MIDFDSKARGWDADPRFIERGRRLAAAIRARVALHGDLRALDYGSGTGHLSFPLHDSVGRFTLVDSAAGMIEVAREKIAQRGIANMEARHGDLNALRADERFDLVCTAMALHHIPDTDAALAAFHDRLEAGGILCVADLDQEDGSFHGPEVEVHHGFDRKELALRAERAGFTDVAFATVFEIEKETPAGMRSYPVFLMTARRV
ncbi:MAG: class I SAM-dependent methyltransferase [Betaproteobacteria bacterium]|nr:class I SAM-dependent methyltransferase [Betaproteobacteria bacterium]